MSRIMTKKNSAWIYVPLSTYLNYKIVDLGSSPHAPTRIELRERVVVKLIKFDADIERARKTKRLQARGG